MHFFFANSKSVFYDIFFINFCPKNSLHFSNSLKVFLTLGHVTQMFIRIFVWRYTFNSDMKLSHLNVFFSIYLLHPVYLSS